MGKEMPAYGSVDAHRDQASISPAAKDEASELILDDAFKRRLAPSESLRCSLEISRATPESIGPTGRSDRKGSLIYLITPPIDRLRSLET